MIYSMTAFSAAEATKEHLTVNIEIRSYNSRHLDVALRIPHGYQLLEDKIKTAISEKISRGRVEIRIKIKDESDEICRYEVNIQKAGAYYNALSELSDKLNLEGKPPLELIAKAGDIISPGEVSEAIAETTWPVIKDCLSNALADHNRMRKKEGDFMAGDLSVRLDDIQAAIYRIEENTEGLLALYQDRLKERIGVLTKGVIELDPARIAQEAALLADKSDISEEITRAKSHIEQFKALMTADEPAGRKLNFLLQEFNREFNTMGSKTGNADLSHLIVAVKSELEKIREQVQNIE